jgi:hypothetical protein
MATQEMVIHQQPGAVAIHKTDELADIQRLGNLLAASGYFSDAREMAQAAVKVMTGRELGIPAIASMMGINIIKGKVALGAHLIASRIRAHGYDFRILWHDNTGCEIEFFTKADGGKRSSLGKTSFTEEDAKAAGVFSSEMYKKYPRNMYYSRCVSNGAKWFTPEIFGGAPVYTPEELGAEVDSEGEMIHREPPSPNREQVASRRITEEQAKVAEITRPTDDHTPRHDPELVSILSGMRDAAGCSETIGRFKACLSDITGNDLDYYRILGTHGFESRQMKGKTAKDAKLAVADLFNFWKGLLAQAEPVMAGAVDE